MTTASFPVTGDNITHAQWAALGESALGLHSSPDWVLSPTTNDLTIPEGFAVSFKGFLLEITADHVLTLPAVTSDTTYHVGVMYDPADEADPAGPLSLVAPTTAGLSIPVGGAFLPLQDITRKNGVALSASTVDDYRATSVGWLTQPDSSAELPPAQYFAEGTAVVTRIGLYVHTGSAWSLVENDTGWRTDGWSSGPGWQNVGSQWRIKNGIVDARFRGRRTGSSFASSGSGAVGDQTILNIPSEISPGGWLLCGRGYASSGGTFGWDWRMYGGTINLTSMNPSTTVSTGGVLYGNAVYILN